MSYVYIQVGNLYEVGFYDGSGKWVTESAHKEPEDASEMVHYLHGGSLHGSSKPDPSIGITEGESIDN